MKYRDWSSMFGKTVNIGICVWSMAYDQNAFATLSGYVTEGVLGASFPSQLSTPGGCQQALCDSRSLPPAGQNPQMLFF